MAEDAWKRLAFKFSNLQTLGTPTNNFANLVDDRRIYNMSPRRFNFYMQVLESIMNPNPEVLTTVVKVENLTRQQRERLKSNLDEVRKFVGVMGDKTDIQEFRNKLNAKLADNVVTSQYRADKEISQLGVATTVLQAANRFKAAPLQKKSTSVEEPKTVGGGAPIEYSDLKKQLDELRLNVTQPKDKDGKPETVSPATNLSKIFKDIGTEPDPSKETELKNQAIAKLYDEPYFSPNNEAVHWSDRAIFIAITYIVRSVALFMVEWGLFSNYITTFQGAFAMYFGMYIIVFLLLVYLTNSRRDDRIFKLAFFYMNTLTSDGKGFLRVALHLIVITMLLPIPVVVKEYREFTQPEILTFTEKTQILNGVDKFTLYSWLLTSVIALNV